MHSKGIIPRYDFVPRGYSHSFETGDLDRVERRFTYHPERLMSHFFDAVAGNLKNGKTFPFPLGIKMRRFPNGIRFTFEGHTILILMPEPMAEDNTVLICTKEVLPADTIYRAAEYFSHDFVLEYKRFFSKAIHQSKIDNGVS